MVAGISKLNIPSFSPQSNFDSLLFPKYVNSDTFPNFLFANFCSDFELQSDDETPTYT
jgi:hypothetical protein